METKDFTKRIDAVLYPYLNRLEYGRLRKSNIWPQSMKNRDVYQLGYEASFNSTGVITLIFNNNDTLSLEYLGHQYNLDKGIKRFDKLLKALPNYRLKQTIRACKLANLSFEDMLVREVKDSNLKETEIYTQWELDKLRNLFKTNS
ncbi:MAG: hypothetical protein KJ623_04680 [Nanoarchaeota archaeon]|nr:hypothetical protein [Nanoarchaeota archaeon]MBU0962514.1 hypothetical protein [Nanoarchaeota archaeon]